MTVAISPKLKFVLSPPDDSDPPTNPIWTEDDIIGISPSLTVIKDLPTPYDYGACGDGATDDSIPMQLWLDAIAGCAGFGACGTFGVSTTLFIWGNTTIYGAGKLNCIVNKLAGFPSTAQLLVNKHQVVSPGVRVDQNIHVEKVGFQGISGDITAVELIAFVGVDCFTFRDCLFQHHRHHLVAGANCICVLIDACEFTDWGRLEVTTTGGEAIWFDATNFDIRIISNYIHNGEWSGMYLSANRVVVTGNLLLMCKEGGITGAPAGISLTGNRISNVVLKNVAGSGISFNGGSSIVISSNSVDTTDDGSITLTDPVLATVIGNICNAAGQNQARFPDSACIQVFSAAGTIQPYNVTISNNQCYGADGKAAHGISLKNLTFPTGKVFESTQIMGNNLGPPFSWRVSPVDIGSNVMPDPISGEFMRRDNIGSTDEDLSTIQFQIFTASTGDIAVGGCGFRPRSIEFKALISSDTLMSISNGQCAWTTGWLVPPGVINSPRSNLLSSCNSWATDGTDVFAESVSGTCCINIVDETGTSICTALVSSLTDDGFILTLDGTTSQSVNVTAVCYP